MALDTVLAKVGLNPAEFTPGELTAIETAVACNGSSLAEAVMKCAPTKSRSSDFTGGNYQWSANADGSFNLFDVPVFVKHVRKLGLKLVAGADGEPKVEEHSINVDEKWLARAVEINQSRHSQGNYRGPLHVRHHPQPGTGDEDKTEAAGQFILKYVRPMMYDGKMVPVLYADFVKIPAAIFERIKAGQLPYRSIESLPPNHEEIDSIALLDTETPWFRLPMLTPGEKIHREVYAATCTPAGSPLRGVAWAADKSSFASLCYFAGGSYSEKPEEKPKDDEASEVGSEEQEGGDSEQSEGEGQDKETKSGTIQCEECGMTHPNDGRHDDEVGYAEMRGEGEGDETMGKILDALTILTKQNQELLNRMPGGVKPPSKAGEGAPVDESGAKESSIQSKASEEGRVAALEQTVGDMKREKEVKAMVAKAITTDLIAYNLGSVASDKLLEKALKSKDPQAHVDAFVETIKEHGVAMPTRYERGSEKPGFVPPPASEIPASCQAYQAKGAAVLEKALAAQAQYLAAKELGAVGSITEAEFIKYRVEPGYGSALKG